MLLRHAICSYRVNRNRNEPERMSTVPNCSDDGYSKSAMFCRLTRPKYLAVLLTGIFRWSMSSIACEISKPQAPTLRRSRSSKTVPVPHPTPARVRPATWLVAHRNRALAGRVAHIGASCAVNGPGARMLQGNELMYWETIADGAGIRP